MCNLTWQLSNSRIPWPPQPRQLVGVFFLTLQHGLPPKLGKKGTTQGNLALTVSAINQLRGGLDCHRVSI